MVKGGKEDVKIINASEVKNMMHSDTLGMEANQLKRLTETGLQFEFLAVAIYAKKKGGTIKTPTGKFEIHTSIVEEGGNRRRKIVLVTQRKQPRRATLGTIFDMLRELGAESFTVIVKETREKGK